MRTRFLILAWSLVAGVAGCRGAQRGGTGDALQLDVYTADSTGFGVTSTLIYGKTEAILVDAQFRVSDAGKVADRVAATGRRLTAIIVTHAHPDHYFGTAVLAQRFPGVPVYISDAGLAEFNRTVASKIAQWTPVYGAEIPPQVPTPAVLPDSQFTVDGQVVSVVSDLQADAASPSNSYVWVPSLEAAIAGDIVYHQTHVWLAESSPQTRQGWLATLRELGARNPRVVVAGHKKRPDLPDTPDAVAFTSRYISDFVAAKVVAQNADELIATMTRQYPNLGLPIVLMFAAKAAFPS